MERLWRRAIRFERLRPRSGTVGCRRNAADNDGCEPRNHCFFDNAMVSMLGSLGVTRRVLLLVMAVCAAACSFSSSPVTPAGTTWRVWGTINIVSGGQLAGPIPGARLTVQDGTNQGAQVTSDSSGRYTFSNLEGGRFTMLIEASGFVSVAPLVALSSDIEVNFALRRTGETP